MKKIANYNLQRRLKLTRGDTIVEVMISMTVLAVVVAAAYAISTRSFQTSLNSQYRDQAISYAQQQLELVKEADNNSPPTITAYTASPGTQFCINPSTKARQPLDGSGNCVFSSLYTVTITYDNSAKLFKATTSWTSANNRSQQSIIFYKPNDSFTGALAGCTAETDSCATTVTNQPAVGLSASNATVNSGSTDTISWAITNVAAGSCAATGPGGFSAVNPNTNPGPFTTTALTTVGNNTFSIACKDNAGNTVSGSTIVSVVNPVPVATTGSASAITYNSATLNGNVNPNGNPVTACTFYYDITAFSTSSAVPGHGTPITCSQSLASLGTGNSMPGPAVYAPTGASLIASKLYHFQACVSTSAGTSCGSDGTFPTANYPAPVITSFYASPSSIAWNSSSTLYWSSNYATSCSRGGTSGNQGTGNLTSTTTYSLTCSGLGGTSAPSYATVSVGAQPPPPCSVGSGGSIVNATSAYISGWGSSCDYFWDSVIGPNGTGTWGPTGRPVCHYMQGGADPWGWLSTSGTWCSG